MQHNILYFEPKTGVIIGPDYKENLATFSSPMSWIEHTEQLTPDFRETHYVDVTTLVYTKKSDLIIDKKKLKSASKLKVKELSKACEANIVSGFVSSALGSEHSYHSDRDDQSNLNTLVSLAIDSPFTCCDTDLIVNPDKTYAFKNHTAAQLKEVLITGTTKKMNCLVAYRTLKAQANAATTDAAINAIVWTEI